MDSTYFVEQVSGKKTLSVLIEHPVKDFFRTAILIFISMSVAWGIWYLCMKQFGYWMLEIDGFNDKKYKMPRLWINIFIYSIAIIYFNRNFKKIATKIVNLENKKYK